MCILGHTIPFNAKMQNKENTLTESRHVTTMYVEKNWTIL